MNPSPFISSCSPFFVPKIYSPCPPPPPPHYRLTRVVAGRKEGKRFPQDTGQYSYLIASIKDEYCVERAVVTLCLQSVLHTMLWMFLGLFLFFVFKACFKNGVVSSQGGNRSEWNSRDCGARGSLTLKEVTVKVAHTDENEASAPSRPHAAKEKVA